MFSDQRERERGGGGGREVVWVYVRECASVCVCAERVDIM